MKIEDYINNYSWFIYPTYSNNYLQFCMTFTNNTNNREIINYLIYKYNGKLKKCALGNHTIMITLYNSDILMFLASIFKSNINYDYLSIYKEYIHIYYNQHLYFINECMI